MLNNKWYVYIIRCKDDTLYTGVAKDVTKRFNEHQSMGEKAAKYVKGRGPLHLVYQREYPDKKLAYKAEWQIKQLSKIKKEELIKMGNIFIISD